MAVLHCNQNDRATRFPRTRHYGGLSFCNFLLAILFAGESTNKGTGLYRILQKKGSRTKFIVFTENRKKCTFLSRINIRKTLILFVKKYKALNILIRRLILFGKNTKTRFHVSTKFSIQLPLVLIPIITFLIIWINIISKVSISLPRCKTSLIYINKINISLILDVKTSRS